MNKSLRQLLICIGFICSTNLCQASEYVPNSASTAEADAEAGVSTLTTDLVNLGGYLGYTIGTTPTSIYSSLLSASTITSYEQTAFLTLFGAIPVNTLSSTLSYFVPSSSSSSTSYASLNGAANNTFSSQPYSTPSSSSGSSSTAISANLLIDQSTSANSSSTSSSTSTSQTYLADPVDQYNLNLFTTPDYSYCMSYDMTSWNLSGTSINCGYMYEFEVMSNVIGPTLPSANEVISYSGYVSNFLNQLNANILLAPLQLNNQSIGTSSSGLSASTQAQAANNFVRYVTESVMPPTLAQYANYDALYTQATTAITSNSTSQDIINTQAAQAALSNYLVGLRVYAAQMSIPVSNFYWALSKRMQQSQSGSDTTTSQALSEYQMASWRITNPNQSASEQWVAQINNASPATVQKEMAVLLSEINYQLYLMRQQDERLLLTNSLLAIVSLGSSKPLQQINTTNSYPPTTTSSTPTY